MGARSSDDHEHDHTHGHARERGRAAIGKVGAAVPVAMAAKEWAVPKVAEAVEWAAPRVTDAVEAARPRVTDAVDTAREVAGSQLENARSWAAPRVELVLEAVEPVVDEARSRGTAAVAALRGELVVPGKPRRSRWRTAGLLAAVAGVAAAGYKALTSGKEQPWSPSAAPTWTPPVASTPSTSAGDGVAADVGMANLAADPLAPIDPLEGLEHPDEDALGDEELPSAPESAGDEVISDVDLGDGAPEKPQND